MPKPSGDKHSEKPAVTGVLLVNTGTPAAPTPEAVREFLAAFLADSMVIDYPRWFWLPILHGIILRVRPKRSARMYARIWAEDGSPLLTGTKRLAEKLEKALAARLDGPVTAAAGMRYGEPSIREALGLLQEQGVDRLLILPLFPQFSGTTTGTILHALDEVLDSGLEVPKPTIIRDYHDHAAYINAVAAQARAYQSGGDVPLLFSFHGVPQRYIKAGDPYEDQCQRSAGLIAEALGLDADQWQIAYQSRFGPEVWLQPYTDEILAQSGEAGIGSLDVTCPGFAVDCLETIDEIEHEGKQAFQAAGGGRLNYIPALNARDRHVAALCEVILSYLPDEIKRC